MLVPHSIHQNQITLPFEVNDEIVVELPVRFRLFVLFTHALLSIVYCHQEKNLIRVLSLVFDMLYRINILSPAHAMIVNSSDTILQS